MHADGQGLQADPVLPRVLRIGSPRQVA